MLQKRDAFTLIEMMVVVLIIGILVSIAIPRYMKTVETSRAHNAVGITHLISIANRMYEIDHPGTYLSGKMNNGHPLVKENYMATQDWGSLYDFFADAGGGASCTRISGTYAGWGYIFDKDGKCTEKTGSTPKCPKI